MKKFISKSELNTQKTDNKNTHYVGEIYPQIFFNDENLKFTEDMQMEIGLIWLGAYKLENNLFSREKCPICGKELLIPYKAVGSILSGCHTIQFWCKNCDEKFVTNNHLEYFRNIYKYVQKHHHEFVQEQKFVREKFVIRSNVT